MSSTASASGAKVSMFGAKSGFVIPKNKLSGSLVPVFQGGKGPGGGNTGNEYNTKQGQRKTKWGPDHTQDAVVKKGRALAYQKRVDQITQQLESGTLEADGSRDPALGSGNVVERSSDFQTNSEVEVLELERREAIGEILKLNPRYKAPPDYKPLMKEARLPIPVKEYPDFNFLSLIVGSRGDTQKRLEKETGAKIQIFGTKTGGGEKAEISPPEGNGIQPAYEELYVKISAETYDKVDAAVAVIEMLITSVSGNLGAASASVSGPGDTSSLPSNSNGRATDAVAGQPTVSFAQSTNSQFQHQGPWFSLASNQTPVGPPLNPSISFPSNPIAVQQPKANPLNPPSLYGLQPGPALHTASLTPSSQSLVQGPYAPELLSAGFSIPPRSFPVPTLQGSLAPQPAFSGPLSFSGSQVEPIVPRPPIRLSAPMALQPVHNVPFRPRPLPDIGSGNVGHAAQPLVPNFRPQPIVHQPGIEQRPSISFPSGIRLNPPIVYSSGVTVRPVPAPAPAPIAVRPSGSIPGSVPSFPSMNPPTTAPPRPLLRDFTFQPQQPNIIRTPQIPPRPSIQSGPLGGTFPRPTLQPSAVELASGPVMQPFSRPQHFGRQIDQSQPHLASPFPGNPRSSSPTFQNFGPPMSRMRPMNSPATPQFPDFSATLPPRPMFRQTVPYPSGRPQNRHQQFYSSGQQVYDPFSPTDA